MRERDESDTSLTLIARLRQEPMDQRAWERFVDQYGPRILTWCRSWRLQEADAQDVAQAVMLKLVVQLQRFDYDPSRSFRGWLRTVVRHAWSDALSAHRPDAGSGESEIVSLLQSQEAREDLVRRLEEQFDFELLEEATRRVQGRVEPRTWEAYRLTAHEGLPGPEAAARMGMKVTAVLMAKSNVLRMLGEEVRDLEGPRAQPEPARDEERGSRGTGDG
jgi:RNA polymerase sigma factor (sigma-70 family)